MATVLSIPRAEWKTFFDRMSKGLVGKRAEIEVASLELGDQIVAEWIPLLGITYEPADDLLDVALDRSSHVIAHPREIVATETDHGLASLAVVDAEGARQIITLKEPLMLPQHSASTTTADA